MDLNAHRQKLASINQEHVLRFTDKLDDAGRRKLWAQLDALDLKLIRQLIDEYVRNKPAMMLPTDIQPVKAFPRKPAPDQRKLYADARARGEQLLKDGKVAAFLVAGG